MLGEAAGLENRLVKEHAQTLFDAFRYGRVGVDALQDISHAFILVHKVRNGHYGA